MKKLNLISRKLKINLLGFIVTGIITYSSLMLVGVNIPILLTILIGDAIFLDYALE